MTLLYSLRKLRLTRTGGPGYALVLPQLDIRAGEKIVLTGPSGCGKSTALDLLGMVLRPDSAERFWFLPEGAEKAAGAGKTAGSGAAGAGSAGAGSAGSAGAGATGAGADVLPCGGNDIARIWAQRGGQDALAALRLRHMGYVLQTGGLLPFLSVYENMALTARFLKLSDTRARVVALAERLGIARLLASMPGQLSIGERQRVAIGRALVSRPRVILADEPTAALDPFHARTVLDLLLSAVDDAGATLLLVTHDSAVRKLAAFRHLHTRIIPLSETAHNAGTAVEAIVEEGVAPDEPERNTPCAV